MRASWRSRTMGMSLAVTAWLALAGAFPAPAAAQISDNKIRIGILGDMSGPNADAHGPGDVVAARMAVADFGGSVRGAPVEVLAGNLLGGPDIGVGIARRWFDEGVDAIFSLGNSAVAIAVQGMAADRNRITIATSAGTDVLTNKACTAVSAHWTFDTYALPVALASGILADGGKDWFFLTIDYAFGHALETQAAKVVQAGGGRVMGNVLHPQGTSDFSGNLTQARSSGANVLGLATSGAPLTSALKQFQEFGLAKTMRPAALLIDINDIHALGLDETQGLLWVTAFYWDQDEQTRAFAQRFFKLHRAMPTMFQASVYSAVTHYLRAIDAAGTDEAKAVMTTMKATPIEDFMTHGARVREDGRVIRPMYLMQVKSPAESRGGWDVAKVVGTVPGDKAFRPLADSECPLVKR